MKGKTGRRNRRKSTTKGKKQFGGIGYLLLFVLLLIALLAINERRKMPKPTPSFNLSWEQQEKYDAILEHPEVYPQDLINEVMEFPETVEFVYAYPVDKDTEIPFEKDWDDGEIPHFLQWDKRWGYKAYSGSYLSVTGCGPTAFAMVYNGLEQAAMMDPFAMGQLAEELGYATPGSGTNDGFFFGAADYLGLRTYVPNRSERSWVRALKKGHPLIINVGPGEFTEFGHYIVVSDWNWKGFKVLDPNSKVLSEKRWTFAELSGQTKGVWAFEKEK